jgi:hypothetical protein
VVKYVTNHIDSNIEEVKIVRETPHYFIVRRGLHEREVRESKTDPRHVYHDSREAAIAHLVVRYTAKVEMLKRQLETTEADLQRLRVEAR